MIYAAYVPSVAIYGIGPTVLEALQEAEPFIEPEERPTLTILSTNDPPDTEADCELLKVRRCTEQLAGAYYESGDRAPFLCFEVNEQGLLDLFTLD